MKKNIGLQCDLHIHTNISYCGGRDVVPEMYYEPARKLGVDTLGFTNHMWDLSVDEPYTWGEAYDVPSILKIKEQIGAHEGLRILIGCETEFPGKLGITPKNAEKFDYVMISPSHLHQKQVVEGLALENAADIRGVLIERTLTAAYQASRLPVPAVISHPFYPLGFFHVTDEVMAGISDRLYEEIFREIAELGVGLELHWGLLNSDELYNSEVDRSERVRFYQTALRCGCKFTIGSDSHVVSAFIERRKNLEMAVQEMGITEKDLMEI